MSVNTHNHEGYYDPTMHDALTNIETEDKQNSFRRIVYICSPYAGNIRRNVADAKRYCRFAISQRCIPLAPHLLYPQILDDGNREQRRLGLDMALALLTKCSELWVFGDRISTGMAGEIDRAKSRNMRIRYFTNACKEVMHEDYDQRR